MAAYEVTNVSEDQIPDPNGGGDLVDALDISFTITGHPGTFTVQVAGPGDTVRQAYDAITARVAEVNAIYSGSAGTTGE